MEYSPEMNGKTRYPVMLVHGAGFRDDNPNYNYWGRIPEKLKTLGADIHYSGQDAWGSIENNAEIVKKNVLRVLGETGAEKINLIAHSKGGLEARYMISRLAMGTHVASLTTISTPHDGSRFIDLVYGFAPSLYKGFSRAANLFFRLLGDRHPDFFNGSRQLSRSMCREFNLRNKDDPRVYYQSYAAKMKNSFSDILFFLTYTFVKILEGDNDGLVAVKSAQYAHFRGTIAGRGLRGVSHADLVDLRRMNSRSFDIIGVYIDIISDLRARGY